MTTDSQLLALHDHWSRQLLTRIDAGEWVVNLRPRRVFADGHVPGAVNIPLRELETRLAELDPSQEIIAYCRSHYCVLSYEAVATLRTCGFKARRLEEGLPEWRAAGLPIAIERVPGVVSVRAKLTWPRESV